MRQHAWKLDKENEHVFRSACGLQKYWWEVKGDRAHRCIDCYGRLEGYNPSTRRHPTRKRIYNGWSKRARNRWYRDSKKNVGLRYWTDKLDGLPGNPWPKRLREFARQAGVHIKATAVVLKMDSSARP